MQKGEKNSNNTRTQGIEISCSERQAVSAPLVAPIELMLLLIRNN
jgi:hypothetical protein